MIAKHGITVGTPRTSSVNRASVFPPVVAMVLATSAVAAADFADFAVAVFAATTFFAAARFVIDAQPTANRCLVSFRHNELHALLPLAA
jgi:hypothetical protein